MGLILIHEQSLMYVGSHLCGWVAVVVSGRSAWAVVVIGGQLSSCVGGRLRAWVVVFVRGRSFSCVGGRCHA